MDIFNLVLQRLNDSSVVIVILILLPYTYLTDSFEVLREAMRFRRDLARDTNGQLVDGRLGIAVYLFSLEWWYTLSVALLVASLFLAAQNIGKSTRLTNPESRQIAERIVAFAAGAVAVVCWSYVKCGKREAMLWMYNASQPAPAARA